MRAFVYPRLWLSGWLFGLVLLLWFSLTPLPLLVPVAQGDKLEHVLSYAVLAGYAGALFAARDVRIAAALGLIALGIVLEWLQGQTSYRFADPYDALANTIGVLLGMAVAMTSLGDTLQWLDARLVRRLR
jgi:VanZ family protein